MSLSAKEIENGRANDQIGTHLVCETDSTRIWHLILKPGQTLPPHRHDRPYFWTVLTDGEGVSRHDDGSDIRVSYVAGDTKYFPDLSSENRFVHDLSNTGNVDLVFVTVEFNNAERGES